MLTEKNHQAILLLTDKLTPNTLELYSYLQRAADQLADVFLLYHAKGNAPLPELKNINIEVFNDDILSSLGYKAIRDTLVPGSNHFPVLQFFLNHPDYSYYWCIEDDVVFNGDWKKFFINVSVQLNYDFITSHIRRLADMPKWRWWKTFFYPDGAVEEKDYINSFNPVYRISAGALRFIDSCLRSGYGGHHEVLFPTLLRKAGFSIADLSDKDNNITPWLSFCTLKTMRFRPVFLFLGNKRNKLYHPVKQHVTLEQLRIYIKRTLTNNKKYLRS